MKVDLHVHTRERSPCARSSADQMVRAAVDAGLDGLVITDHDRLVTPEELTFLNRKYMPFRVFGGVEVTTHGEHVLVLGVWDDALEHGWWTYPDLHAFVQARHGFLVVAHPFRFNREQLELDTERFPPHALEGYSHNTPERVRSRILELAARLDVPVLSNSDAHHSSSIGAHYNALDQEPRNVETLIRLLEKEAFEPVAPHGRTSAGEWLPGTS